MKVLLIVALLTLVACAPKNDGMGDLYKGVKWVIENREDPKAK